ncbi:MAG: glycerol-3-phosphate acyltransferase, partial [Ideonella sp.]
GHLWPVFFCFKGGKGVATAAGVLLALNPLLGLATLATWVIIAAFFRYSSLASIVAALFAPFYQLLIWGGGPLALAVAMMSLLLLWRHATNFEKLLKGTESRIGHKAASGPSSSTKSGHSGARHHPSQHAHSSKGKHKS